MPLPSSASTPAPGDQASVPAESGTITFLLRLWPWVAAIASGVLLALCFPRFHQGWLVWTALTPVIAATWLRPAPAKLSRPARFWHAFGPGYVAGLVFFTFTFHWLSELAPLYSTATLRVIPLLLGGFFGLYTGAWTWFLAFIVPLGEPRRFGNAWRNLATGASGASAWVVLEWTRGWFLGGFGWNGLGIALHRDLPMIQIADLTGVWGVSWLVAFVNVMAVIIIRSLIGDLGPRFLRRIRWEFTVTMLAMTGVFSYGVRALLQRDASPTVNLRVAAIQPNIPQTEKFDPTAELKVLDTIGDLTALATVAKPPPHLVVWPESSTPSPLFDPEDSTIRDWVMEIVQQRDFALLLGTTHVDPADRELYNVATLLTERGATHQTYRKRHLVPFGEYLPLRPVLGPLLGGLLPGDFARGREFTQLRLKEPAVNLAALVCFEDTLGDLTRRFVLGGSQLLVNVTNDGWFAKSAAAEQHLANAVFRTIETRRPLVRCGNTGVTGSIDSHGRRVDFDRHPGAPAVRNVIPFLKPFEQGFVAGQVAVPVAGPVTFYTRHGDWFPLASIGLTLLAVARAAVRRARP